MSQKRCPSTALTTEYSLFRPIFRPRKTGLFLCPVAGGDADVDLCSTVSRLPCEQAETETGSDREPPEETGGL